MTGIANLVLLGTVSEMEHLETKNGKPWVKLLIEVKTWRRGGDGETGQEESTLLTANVFSRMAYTARQQLRIGDPVVVTCRVSGTEYRADGKVKRGITLTADQLHLIPSGRVASSSPGSPMRQKYVGQRFQTAQKAVRSEE